MTRRPRTVSGWIDQLNARVRKLELARSQKVGKWVLEERQSDGVLVARHTVTGTVVDVAVP
jgi:hypothetical protein